MNIIKSALISLVVSGAIIGSTGIASALGSTRYQSTITAPVTYPVKVQVVLSDDLAYRADHLPKSLRDRGNVRGLTDGFGGNGFYGERDLEMLVEKTSQIVTEQLRSSGLVVTDSAPATLRITLTDVRPSRPTFTQMSKSSGLSRQSVANGGATFEAEMIGQDGQSLGTLNYGWYETTLDQFSGASTWSDTRRAIGRFSRKLAGALT